MIFSEIKLSLLIGLGGAIGALCRYWLMYVIKLNFISLRFPLATLIVNVGGSFLAGLLASVLLVYLLYGKNIEFFLFIGFLGGFTTFSAFSLEVVQLVNHGHFVTALSYIVLSLVLSVLAAFFGFGLGKLLI